METRNKTDLSNSGVSLSPSYRPLALAAMVDETCRRERLSLAESRAQRVHACTFPLFVIDDGGQWRHVQSINRSIPVLLKGGLPVCDCFTLHFFRTDHIKGGITSRDVWFYPYLSSRCSAQKYNQVCTCNLFLPLHRCVLSTIYSALSNRRAVIGVFKSWIERPEIALISACQP